MELKYIILLRKKKIFYAYNTLPIIRFDVYIIFQEKLQNSFRQATTKISATIGLGLPRVDNNEPAPIEVDDMMNIDAEDMSTIDADAVTDNDDDWFFFFISTMYDDQVQIIILYDMRDSGILCCGIPWLYTIHNNDDALFRVQ